MSTAPLGISDADGGSVFDLPAREVLGTVGIAYKVKAHGGATWYNFTGRCPLCQHEVSGDACGVSMRPTYVAGQTRYVHAVRCFHGHDSPLGEAPRWGDFLRHVGALEHFPARSGAHRREFGVPPVDLAGGDDARRPPSPEWLEKMEARLWKEPKALDYLRRRGLTDATVRRYRLGLRPKLKDVKECDCLSAPTFDREGRPAKPYVNYVIPGLTTGAGEKTGWAKGEPATYYADRVDGQEDLFVAEGLKDLWRLRQALEGTDLCGRLLIVSSTHGTAHPAEWAQPGFWRQWTTVYVGTDRDAAGDAFAARIAALAGRPCRRAAVPEGLMRPDGTPVKDWTDLFLAGHGVRDFAALLEDAPSIAPRGNDAAAGSEEPLGGPLGRTEYRPVDLGATFEDGYLYYPVETMVRSVVPSALDEHGQPVVSEDVATVVVRSDRTIHVVHSTSLRTGADGQRVYRLKPDAEMNGGRAVRPSTIVLRRPPRVNAGLNAWAWPSIRRWLNGETPVRPLRAIVDDLEAHFRRVVYLPHDDDYTLLALTAVVTYVQPVFDAVPLLLVNGPHGSGKSTVGNEIARVAFNGMTIGPGSAAAIVRQIDETRGFVSLDDLEAISGRPGAKQDPQFGELVQTLKQSYQRETALKAWYNMKSGRSETLNFFGVKVLTNTSGVDAILGSRMFRIYTRRLAPEDVKARAVARETGTARLREIRDELYAWAFDSAVAVAEAYAAVAPSRTDRADEIGAPLRALARLTGDPGREATVDRIVQRQRQDAHDPDDPEAVLEEAVRELVRQGYRQVSPTHLSLEMAHIFGPTWGKTSTTDIPEWQNPEWLGRKLRQHRIVDPDARVTRPRVEHGLQLRVYPIAKTFLVETLGAEAVDGQGPEPLNPVTFCRGCGGCPYRTAGCTLMAGRTEWEARRRPALRPGDVQAN